MKKTATFIFSLTFLSILLLGCKESNSTQSSTLVGIYENMGGAGGTKIEIKEDSTYIIWKCELDMTGIDLRTADPDKKIPLKCTQESTGKWVLNGDVISLDDYPYELGIKQDELFFNDQINGTIEYIKE